MDWLEPVERTCRLGKDDRYPLPPSMPHTFSLRLSLSLSLRLRFWLWLWLYHWFWFWLWLWFWFWLRGRLRGHLYFLYYLLFYGYTTCSESPGERGGGGRRRRAVIRVNGSRKKGKEVQVVSR